MEIRIYNNQFQLLGIIENQTSLLWTRKYNNTGSFSLVVPLVKRNIDLLQEGYMVWIMGKPEAGVIETVLLEENADRQTMTAGGRFLECYMSRRLIYPATNFSGTVEDAMRSFFTNAASLSDSIVLGERHGYEETVDMQVGYKSLLDTEQNLAKSANFGIQFTPDFVNKVITFNIYKGVDHSKNQSDRARVTFSAEYANLTSATYSYNDQLAANVCYVLGEGYSDTDPQKVCVIAGDDTLEGLARREMTIMGNTASNGLTIAQYRAKLKEEGELALANAQTADSFTCMVSPTTNFIYGKHYDLGDIVTVEKKEWGIDNDYRITEIMEIYESELPKIEVTLGTTLPEKINWEV